MKTPFVTKAQIEEIVKTYPTPFHIYDEKGIRENARKLKQAFAWNKGYKEYFAVKATPNPTILKILKEEGCGIDIKEQEVLLDEEIENLIEERQAARKAKNFARADEIRDLLTEKGIILEDTREGVRWKRA